MVGIFGAKAIRSPRKSPLKGEQATLNYGRAFGGRSASACSLASQVQIGELSASLTSSSLASGSSAQDLILSSKSGGFLFRFRWGYETQQNGMVIWKEGDKRSSEPQSEAVQV